MKQRISSNSNLIRKKERRKFTFRKEEFDVLYHYLEDTETGETLEDEELAELNTIQLYNQYRVKHNLPFPEEIKEIREKYEVSASKMSEILGFGINQYRNYENGEIPSVSNGRLIQLIKDPKEFKRILLLSEIMDTQEFNKLKMRVEELIFEKKGWPTIALGDYLMGNKKPDEYTGFRSPNLEKFCHMVLFFAEKTKPFKTKMNKLLFYADFKSFQETCLSISGARYRAIQYGPVPNNFQSLYEFAAANDFIRIIYNEHPDGTTTEEYDSSGEKKFNDELFSLKELGILNNIAQTFKKVPTNKIVDISHNEKAWKDCQDSRSIISYEYAFDLTSA